MSASRVGASLLEAVVALTLGALILHLVFVAVDRVGVAQRSLVARFDGVESLRVTRFVLRRELRHALPGRDWTIHPDSVVLRAFRGTAIVCGAPALDEITVWYRGDRRPDPGKDSVLVVDEAGAVATAELVSVVTGVGPCSPGTQPAERWTLDRTVPHGAVLARNFENGSYHLDNSALRYRRGAGGRQPLTPEAWWSAASGWDVDSASASFTVQPKARTRAYSGFLAWLR